MAVPHNSGDNGPAAEESGMPAEESPIPVAPSGERSNSPGVRILDSENYVYCHQVSRRDLRTLLLQVPLTASYLCLVFWKLAVQAEDDEYIGTVQADPEG